MLRETSGWERRRQEATVRQEKRREHISSPALISTISLHIDSQAISSSRRIHSPVLVTRLLMGNLKLVFISFKFFYFDSRAE